ncbi:MAG: hypothetical protein K2U26_18330 [Cyclobacteriaceae bacterium]|nr:hypothetical protein [Cyclobacteriaceae bacterium]
MIGRPDQNLGYAATNTHIFVRSFRDYQIYSFEANRWEKLKLNSLPTSSSGWSSTFIPEMEVIISFGEGIEALYTETLQLKDLAIPSQSPQRVEAWNSTLYLYAFHGFEKPFSSHNSINIYQTRTGYSDKIYRFDLAKPDSMIACAPLPKPLDTKGKFVNGKLYLFGGYSEEGESKEIYCYDPTSDSWQTVGELAHPISRYGIATDGNLIYIMGCRTDEKDGYLIVFNPSNRSSKEYKTNLRFYNGCVVAHGEILYFFGGVSIDNSMQVNNKLYAISLNQIKP